MNAELRKAIRKLLQRVCGQNARRHLRTKLRAAWEKARKRE